MPDFPDILELTIDRLGGLGDGMGMWQGERIAVPKTLAGERITASVTGRGADCHYAHIVSIETASPERHQPPCEHYAECGGCSLQHLNPDAYQAFKKRGVTEALRKSDYETANAETVFFPAASRRRADFKLLHGSSGVRLAFHLPHSHRLTPIKRCIILTPTLQEWLPHLESAMTGIQFRSSPQSLHVQETEAGADLVLRFTTPPTPSDMDLAKGIGEKSGSARLSCQSGRHHHIVHQSAEPTLTLGQARVALPPGCFLQATAAAQQWLQEHIRAALAGSRNVIDLFSGIGTYSFPLAAQAKVHAVEGDEAMTTAIAETAKASGLPVTSETRDLMSHPVAAKALSHYGAAVINPPRAGAKMQVTEIARSGIRRVVMVSCNPATFARDAAILREKGFRLEQIAGLDQFVWSAHLEIYAVFSR